MKYIVKPLLWFEITDGMLTKIYIFFLIRSSVLQREVDNLRRELETANQRTTDCDRAARDAQVYVHHSSSLYPTTIITKFTFLNCTS